MSKKVNDTDVIALNSVGISLAGIAKRLNCHHTTVTSRLGSLGVSPADTRRHNWLAGEVDSAGSAVLAGSVGCRSCVLVI